MTANGASRRSNSEKFNVKVDTQTGSATCTIPIPTSSARSCHVDPVLSLEYSSGSAVLSGVFGMGWRLAGVDSISRKTSRGVPTYDDDADADVFVHSALGDLVPSDKPTRAIDGLSAREYRARVEGQPTRFEQWTTKDRADTFWRVTSSTNVVAIYGLSDGDRIFCQIGSGLSAKKRIFLWLAFEQFDSCGNRIVYMYKPEDNVCESGVFDDVYSSFSQRYLKRIRYGNVTPRMFLSLGSMLGNDHFEDAVARLKWLCSTGLRNGYDTILLTMDGTKDLEKICKSYDDAEGLFTQLIRQGFEDSNNVLGDN
ncbi:hypothetical protein V8C35DRAFT_318403 [Trichoderma chlorosporum]